MVAGRFKLANGINEITIKFQYNGNVYEFKSLFKYIPDLKDPRCEVVKEDYGSYKVSMFTGTLQFARFDTLIHFNTGVQTFVAVISHYDYTDYSNASFAGFYLNDYEILEFTHKVVS